MNRVLIIVGVLNAVALVAPVGLGAQDRENPSKGTGVDCVPQERCGEGQRPPRCCAPPPCQIFEHLKQMRAVRHMMEGKAPEKALRQSKGDHAKAIESLRAAVEKEWGTLKSRSGCRSGGGPFTVPRFRLSKGCSVEFELPSGWTRVSGPEGSDPGSDPLALLDRFDSCNELVEAAFAQAGVHKDLCVGAVPGNVGWWAQRESAAAQAGIDATMLHLQRYFSACSSPETMDEATRGQLEEAGVDMSNPDSIFDVSIQTLKGARR